MRKSTKGFDSFFAPNVPDLSLVVETDIKMILPPPVTQGLTKRQTSLLKFEINFTNLNIK